MSGDREALTGGGFQPVARSDGPRSGDDERRGGRQPRTAPRTEPKPSPPVTPPPGGGGISRPAGK